MSLDAFFIRPSVVISAIALEGPENEPTIRD